MGWSRYVKMDICGDTLEIVNRVINSSCYLGGLYIVKYILIYPVKVVEIGNCRSIDA